MFDLVTIEKKGFWESRDEILKVLPRLSEKYPEPHDANTPEGYEKNAECAKELKAGRLFIAKGHKKEKESALEECNRLDKLKRDCTKVMDPLENQFKNANLDHDDREAAKEAEAARVETERVENITTRIDQIKRMPLDLLKYDSSHIRKEVVILSNMSGDWAQEYHEKARVAIVEAIKELTDTADFKQDKEDHAEKVARDQVELEKQRHRAEEEHRKEQAEIAKKNREESDRLAKERAANEQIEREKKMEREEAWKKIEAEKAELAASRRRDEEKKEQDARNLKRKEEQAKVEADRKAKVEATQIHRITQENDAIAILIDHYSINQDIAAQIICDIVEGEFTQLSINY